MASDLSFSVARGGPSKRAPGLHFVDVRTQRAEADKPHGMPLFVGFGQRVQKTPSLARPVLELSGWEHFQAWVDPTEDGFLRSAVRGFFANGGKLCAVLPVSRERGAEELMRPFADGGTLEDIADIGLVCVPDAVASFFDATTTREIQTAVLRYCEAMGDRFAILDALPSTRAGFDEYCLDAVTEQSCWLKTRFGALYFPWVRVDSRGHGTAAADIPVPPCGHVAGIYARTDARTGVHKAPANEILEDIVALEVDLSHEQHALLNDAGVNCIRSSPGRDIRVWGARTLSGQSEWLYVPVTRLFLALAAWLKGRVDDLVFEPHTPELWQRLRRRLTDYCLELMDTGALAGRTPESAFFVKCDSENNPPASRDVGRLVADVGLAPARPAEFVVVRITHDANGIVVTGL